MVTKPIAAIAYDRTQVVWRMKIGEGDNAGSVRVMPVNERKNSPVNGDERGTLLEALQFIAKVERRLTASKKELQAQLDTLPEATSTV